jgi:hypothetical protein
VEHHRLSIENAKIEKEATEVYEKLVKSGVAHKFDSFLPRNDSERAGVARYKALKASLHLLPDFYFRDIGLRWQFGSPGNPEVYVVDEKIREECRRVQERIVKLFSKYEDA